MMISPCFPQSVDTYFQAVLLEVEGVIDQVIFGYYNREKPSENMYKKCLIHITVKTKLAKVKSAIYTQTTK